MNATETLLVIDMGTTNIKAVVFDLRGRVVRECSRPTPVVYGPESMEIDPAALWREVKAVCGEAAGGDGRIAAVSMSSMAASFIPLDSDGKPLHPAIGWADPRALPFVAEHMRSFLDGVRIPGCGQYPLQMYLPFKIEWFARAHPDAFRRVRKWLNVSEYVYTKLADLDEPLTDHSIASRTMLFDTGARRWNAEALRRFGIDPSLLPRPAPAGTVIGKVGRELRELGFDPETAVVMGGHDHMCFVPGAGITGPDVMLNTTGTSEAMLSLLPLCGNGSGAPDDGAIAGAWLNSEAALQPGRTAVVGYTGASGRVFQSLRETLGSAGAETWGAPPAAATLFLPPQRAQLVSVKGELRGLSPIFDSAAVFRAICDGMYMECRRVMERIALFRSEGGVGAVRMAGGHTRNTDEVRRKSAALGVPVEIVRQPAPSSLGAAVVAGAGCGLFAGFEEAAKAMFHGGIERVEPDPALAEAFDRVYRENYLPCFAEGVLSL